MYIHTRCKIQDTRTCKFKYANLLHKRTQTVILDGQQSDDVKVKSGDPQRTVLGPLLFLLYINDIGAGVKSIIKLFADDCLLYKKRQSPDDCVVMQTDLDLLSKRSDTWLMYFNVKKHTTISITTKKFRILPAKPYNINNTPLTPVTEAV